MLFPELLGAFRLLLVVLNPTTWIDVDRCFCCTFGKLVNKKKSCSKRIASRMLLAFRIQARYPCEVGVLVEHASPCHFCRDCGIPEACHWICCYLPAKDYGKTSRESFMDSGNLKLGAGGFSQHRARLRHGAGNQG